MKKLFAIIGIFVVVLGISGCGQKDYSVSNFVNESQVTDKKHQYIKFDDKNNREKLGQSYISPDHKIIAYFKDGQLTQAFLTNGPSNVLQAVNGKIYISDVKNTYFYNENFCLINNQEQKLDSEECKKTVQSLTPYDRFIKENFKSLLK